MKCIAIFAFKMIAGVSKTSVLPDFFLACSDFTLKSSHRTGSLCAAHQQQFLSVRDVPQLTENHKFMPSHVIMVMGGQNFK